MFKKYGLIATGPLAGLATYLLMRGQQVERPASLMAFVVVWVAAWWITEAVHLAVTSLLPVVLMPLLGLLKMDQAAMLYMNQIIFLFIGGFFLAYAMEKWKLHERLAYRIILLTGNTPSKVLLGVMVTTYFISMWVSNTATVMMLIAAVMAIVKQKELYHQDARKGIATALLVGLSFSATIGGMGTLVGTPPNMIFYGAYKTTFPHGQQFDFLKWMLFGVPFSMSLLAVCYVVLRKMFIPRHLNMHFDMGFIRDRHRQLGRMNFEEKTVLIIFLITVLLWFFRDSIDLGSFKITGWSEWIFGEYSRYIEDSTVVVFTALILFLVPSKSMPGQNLLEWRDVERVPLHIILLFGAGFAISKGFETSGLSTLLATQLQVLKGVPAVAVVICLAVLVTVLSELASNTASIQLVLPIIIPLSATLGINPLLLMLTATFSASLGYMLPVATAANTIVYGSNEIDARDMMRAGLVVDIAGIILLVLFMLTLGNWLYGFKIFG